MNDNQKKLISDLCLNINKDISKNKKEIDERLKSNLDARFKKLDNLEKYIESIKYNVMLYKVSIRHIEVLLTKYIKKQDIFDKDKLETELKRISLNCKQYINKATQSKGASFNEYDLKIFLLYENIEKNDLRNKLENEYKILNTYNYVLNIFIRNLIHLNKEDIILLDSDENIKFIKTEIRKTVDSIVKASNIEENKNSNKIKDKLEEKQVIKEEVCPQLNALEVAYLDALNTLENDKLTRKMDKEYKVLCILEEMDDSRSYGFGSESIKEYIGSIVLLGLVNEKYRDLIEGGIRLLINGEFGATNFGDYIKHLAVKELDISIDVWNEANEIICNKFNDTINHHLAKKPIKEYRNDIDLSEYVFMIENADKNLKFRKDDDNDLEKSWGDEVSNEIDSTGVLNSENIYEEPENDEIEFEKLEKPKRTAAKIITALVIVLFIGISGVSIAVSKKKPESKQQENPVVVKEDDSIPETYSEKDYIIADSNTRYLTKEELSDYTKAELGLIRNEIFARYGYVFATEPYKTYFNSKNWYEPNEVVEANSELLNEVEKVNLELIKHMESGGTEVKNTDPVSYDYLTGYEEVYYNVYTEAYSIESEAQNHMNELSNRGILSEIVEEDGYYKVRVGASATLDEANEISQVIKEKSFDTYILAYDLQIEEDLANLEYEGLYGDFRVFQQLYYELEYEISDKLAYDRYIKQLEEIYDLVNQ